ncbi:SRPBCC domain-containing protein [Pseudomonas sp. H3(2019)]|uniref:SRPBCC domain-containing protein n=1 Tax=Pseudomonas sp. H3(2019) TaxID=2598724 RepID=UPI001193165F|nr:SRPBCC domain-containing protein [Pseudomonas sp. H3(2019)]TVT86077.1 hypothetical protein FPT12_03560 [Pseudomonas sp. H3(2019)]
MHKVSKQFVFTAGRSAVYRCLTDPVEFANFTGMSAEMDARPGAHFSLFGGYIKGYFLELHPEHRLVMAWRDCYSWEEGIYSIVNIQLDEVEDGTRMSWTQHGVPTNEVEHLGVGLGRKYFNAIQQYLASGEVQGATPDACKIPQAE